MTSIASTLCHYLAMAAGGPNEEIDGLRTEIAELVNEVHALRREVDSLSRVAADHSAALN